MTTPEKFVIERSRWLHGEGGSASKLLRCSDQKMCCLGFFAKACGLSDGDISCTSNPAYLPAGLRYEFPEWLFLENLPDYPAALSSNETEELIDVNDAQEMEDSVRETRIKELFAAQEIEVVFEGEYNGASTPKERFPEIW